MQYCEFCGEESLGSPYRRKMHYYCSRTCADDHEFELVDDDVEEGAELEFEHGEDEFD